jgi:hypothetical protein
VRREHLRPTTSLILHKTKLNHGDAYDVKYILLCWWR